MRGVGRASGAITFVNALVTGVGCAAAVDLPLEVEVTLRESPGLREPTVDVDRSGDTPLVRATALAALQQFSPESVLDARVSIRSRIPIARGLKSSSAVSTAIFEATARALGIRPASEQLARWAADVAQRIGQSATGAFDDALASTRGGIVVTENQPRRVLKLDEPEEGLEIVLWVPRETHLPSTAWAESFRERRAEGHAAVEAALRGEYVEAFERNTGIVEQVLGYDYGPMRQALLRKGARVAGVSGMGPTLVALVPAGRAAPVAQVLPRDRGEVIQVRFRGSLDGVGGEAG